ncbi:hypothetical protein [Streptomyces sp. NPDC047065]|uniref:hypothetical protein n=1 Tax=Streptomyces sp. NPDC047065 TaxID=3154606 RepID=UPI0033E7CA36
MSPLLLSEIDHVVTCELGHGAALSVIDEHRHRVRRGRAVLSEITDDHLSAYSTSNTNATLPAETVTNHYVKDQLLIVDGTLS